MNALHPGSRSVFFGALLVLIAGCQSAPTTHGNPLAYVSVKQRLVEKHQAQARQFETKGALREAQREWQLVDALSSRDSDARSQIARLGREIDRRFAQHLAAAEQAVGKRRWKTARAHLLEALALAPDNARAIALMRSNEARLAYAVLDREPAVARGDVSEAEVYLATDKQTGQGRGPRKPTAMPSSSGVGAGQAGVGSEVEALMKQGLKHLSRQEYQAALTAFERAQASGGEQDSRLLSYLAQAQRGLAERHYELGVAAFRAARYAEAVTEFQLVLQHVPDHHKARFYLSSAQSLQKK